MGVIIGTAGWSIARADCAAFPEEGTALERYSRVFGGVEVNSSFHRPHRASTWARWAASVPDAFRFAVKVPKTITHGAGLVAADRLIDAFSAEVGQLGLKLAVLLVQLPPKLAFDADVAARFFEALGTALDARIACEPRHASWFDDEADGLLDRLRVARVAADPALGAAAAIPGGWRGLAYWRLHGAPVMYRSSYSDVALDHYARELTATAGAGIETWCMFDNTAAMAATANALALMDKVATNGAQPLRNQTSLDAAAQTLALLARRAPEATICPSEVARVLATASGVATDWRDAMPLVHEAVDRLLDEGRVDLSWKGKPLPARTGPYRIGRGSRP